jgi:RND superfamily putative drug exporter
VSALTRWVLAHKRIVVISWIVLTIAGVAAAGPATDALDQDFSVPGKEGWETNEEINDRYGGTAADSAPLVPVVTLPEGQTVDSPEAQAQLAEIDRRVTKALPEGETRIASYASTGDDAFVSEDRRTTFAIVHWRAETTGFESDTATQDKIREAVRGVTVAGAPVQLTGYDLLSEGEEESEGPGVLVETLIGGVGALAVLAFVFASLLAFVPLAMAICSILTTFLLLLGLTQFTDVSPIVQFLVALIGLGLAIDYSLLVSTRWREERAHGHTGDEAVQRAMETAGRAVVFSGTTVAVGLLALVAIPLPFVQSMAWGGMLIPLVSTVVAITLLPVVLSKVGGRLDWPHIRTDDRASRAWTRWAEAVTRRRWLAAGAGMAVLGALLIGASNLHLGDASTDSIARAGVAKDALAELDDSGIGKGAILPHEVLVEGDADPKQVANSLDGVEDVQGAVAPSDWRRGGTAVVDVFGRPDVSTSEGGAVLDRVRETAHAEGPEVKVGGFPAVNDDFISAVYGNFPLMLALIAVITFLLLARAFRSLLLPLKAVILNVVSVAAAWGVLVFVWQEGFGSEAIWGIEATGGIPAWMPLMVFAFLYGLSMDYEVFILSRMREEYDRTGSTETAVVRGIGRTGRLVTSAALILFLAFAALASGPETDVKMLATGLAAGILLDATVVRALLVPAMVSLFGRWNWWLPHRPAKLLGVEPSLPPRVAPSEGATGP